MSEVLQHFALIKNSVSLNSKGKMNGFFRKLPFCTLQLNGLQLIHFILIAFVL